MDLTAAATEMVERTTREQGLPFHVEDDPTVRSVASVLRTGLQRDLAREAPNAA